MILSIENRRELLRAMQTRMTSNTSIMVVEVPIKGLKDPSDPSGGGTVKVHINGMELPFPEEEGTETHQVNEETMDERFTSVNQAIAAYKSLNAAAKQARRLYWGHEGRLVIESFVHEFDDKGSFLEHTPRQRWTLGG